jgi:hypothetical protein
MADNQRRYGLRWQRVRGGNNLSPERHFVATGYQATSNAINVDLRQGDPVKKVSDGSIALVAAGNATFGVIEAVAQYYVGAPINAVVPGGPSLPGGTAWGTVQDRISLVMLVPIADQIFEWDCDDAVTATTEASFQAFVGENVDASMNGVSGDTRAYPLLDISTHNTTNTLVWRIVRVPRDSFLNQDFSGNYVKLLVTGNVAQQAPFTTTGV